MDYLDETQIDSLIEVLLQAKTIGFSISSSPIEPLLEVMVDLSLKLQEAFQEGRAWEARTNKLLKFSTTDVDSLGNPKVITSEKPRTIAWDPSSSLFFKELAQTLVRLKTTKRLPKDLYSNGKPASGSSQQEQPVNRKTAVYHFYRRTRLRKKK